MKTTKFLNRIQEIFFRKLDTKTGWGKNEIKTAYREAQKEALMEIADQVLDQSEIELNLDY